MTITIRPAMIEDVPGMAQVRVTTWRQAYAGIVPDEFLNNLSVERSIEAWRKNLFLQPTPGDFSLVALDDSGQVVGFAIGGAERDGDPLYRGEIYALYILPECQHQGIGRRLVQAGAAALQRQGFTSLLIWALSQNPNLGFYLRLGGHPLRTKQQEIGGKVLEETAFAWDDLSVLLTGTAL